MPTASVLAVIYAKDLARMVAFYEAVLHLSRQEESADFVLLAGADFELSVVAIPADIAVGIELAVPPAPREDTPIKLSFMVHSIEALRELVARAGGTLKPHGAEWIWRSQQHLDGLDPEGNVFQLRQLVP
jgi:predicted enzyme related to lactoylglutathione lyase